MTISAQNGDTQKKKVSANRKHSGKKPHTWYNRELKIIHTEGNNGKHACLYFPVTQQGKTPLKTLTINQPSCKFALRIHATNVV